MRHKLLSLNDENKDLITFSDFNAFGTNYDSRKRMKNFLSLALSTELTGRQRQCLMMYYVDGLKMYEIAEKLGISSSTVSRHLKSAHFKLRDVSKYCE